MATRKKKVTVSTSEGFWFGIWLLGQVTGILVAFTVLGFLLDELLGTRPLGMAIAAFFGSLGATALTLYKVRDTLS